MNKRFKFMPVGVRRFAPAQYARLLYCLSALFALRVAGQALQYWMPSPWLPAFDDFQGSSLSYDWLLSMQLFILALMLLFARRVHLGEIKPSLRAGRLLAWTGSIYMAGSLARIAVGLLLPQAPPWFSSWIPAFFHLVLAAFVLALARYHCLSAKTTVP